METNKIISALQEATTLGIFKRFCEKNKAPFEQKRLRNIYSATSDTLATTKNLIKNELCEDLDTEQATRMMELISAYLKKSQFRKTITDSEKRTMLDKQDSRCAICGKAIGLNGHADHIVPFKYVGDELDNNLQMLCSDCNLKKNASIDFQIRYYLGLI